MPGSNTFLVVEKAGRVMAVQDGDVMSSPVLDIRDQVSNDWNERVLLSIETHPDFAENCRVFLFFTDLAGDSNLVAATVRVQEYMPRVYHCTRSTVKPSVQACGRWRPRCHVAGASSRRTPRGSGFVGRR